MKPYTNPVVPLALFVAVLACTPKSEAPPAAGAELAAVLPFVENDYAAALSRAREAKLPLFVEVWAPW